MLQELVSEAGALGSTFNETGNIREYHMVVFNLQDTQIRSFRRERIVPNLGMGGRQSSEEAGLPCIRFSYEPDIRDEPKLNLEREFRPGLSVLRKSGGLMAGCGKMRIALAAATTVKQLNSSTVLHRIHKDFPCIAVRDDRTGRHLNDRILAVTAVSVPGSSPLTVSGSNLASPRQVQQRPKIVPNGNDEVTAPPPVTTVRSALGNVLLPSEGDLPRTAMAG